MLALSVRQPYAYLIAEGAKTLELRSRPTLHRGDLLIVASKSVELSLYDEDTGGVIELPRGVQVCIVAVTDCYFAALRRDRKAACVDTWAPGLWAWELRNPRHVEPVPQRGYAAFFHVLDSSIHRSK